MLSPGHAGVCLAHGRRHGHLCYSRPGGISEFEECAEVSLRTIFRAVMGWGPDGQWGADLLKVVGDSVSQLKAEALLGEISDTLTAWQSSDRTSRALSAIQSLTDSFQASIKDDKMMHDIEAMSKLAQILKQLPTRFNEITQTLWSMTCSAVGALGSALIMIKDFRTFDHLLAISSAFADVIVIKGDMASVF